MVKSKLYLAGDREEYTMETMVDRIVYWWVRYEGSRTEDGKEFSRGDVYELIWRLGRVRDNPKLFRFNNPDMEKQDKDEVKK